jgi:hypothetical protein
MLLNSVRTSVNRSRENVEKSFIDFSTNTFSIDVSNFRFNLYPNELPFVLLSGSGLYFVVNGISNSRPACSILSRNKTPYKLVLNSTGLPSASKLLGSYVS